jgi:hypothetical protein
MARFSMPQFLAHWLILLAAWTLAIKFGFPIAYDATYGHPLGTHIFWDFWWVAQLWLAYALLRWQSYTYRLAIGVSVIEIAIIVTKFFWFLQEPNWDLWHTNWFINKLFVLSCFVVMLGYFVVRRETYRQQSSNLQPAEEPGHW